MTKKMDYILAFLNSDTTKASLMRGVGGGAIVKLFNILVTMISGVLLARIMGPSNYGEYAFLLSIVIVIGLPIRAGLPTLLIREITKYNQNSEWSYFNGILKASNRFALVYSMIAIATSVTISLVLFEASKVVLLGLSLTLIPLIGFEQIRMGVLRGLRYVVLSQLAEQIVRPVSILLFISFVWIYDVTFLDIQLALIINIVATVIALMVSSCLLKRKKPSELIKVDFATYEYKKWIKSLIPITTFSAISVIDSQVSNILLGAMSTKEHVGLFKVAITSSGVLILGISVVNTALAPQVAKLYNSGDMQNLQSLLTFSVRIVMLTAFPIFISLFLWGDTIIGFLFGKEYSSASTALNILIIGQLVNCGFGSVALVLNMTGNEKKTVVAALISLAVNISTSSFLIPLYGANGAAIACTISVMSWNVILFFVSYKTLGINTSILSLSKR